MPQGIAEDPEVRFWMNVDSGAPSGCWEWSGYTFKAGYGGISIGGTMVYAHRLSYELHYGPITNGLCVLHRCDNPKCVRPDHLFLGTRRENAADRDSKGRQAKGEASGPAKLRESEVLAIRELYRRYRRRARVARGLNSFLSRWFGVAAQTVGEVASGVTWRTA